MDKELLHPWAAASPLSAVQDRIQWCQQCPLHGGLIPLHKSSFANLPNLGLLRCLGSHAFGPCHCRFISDAVTGVSIVTILFFFPCQRPSLKWWLDFKGKVGKVRLWGAWSKVIRGLVALTTWSRSFPFPVRALTMSGYSGLPEVTVQGRG